MFEIDGLILIPEKAIIKDNIAIIADLHLGIESLMLDYGVTFPRVQIREIIENVERIVEKYGVDELVIAGDLKHEFGKNLPHEWEDVELFLQSFPDLEIKVIRGNHDNFLATILSRYEIKLVENIEVDGWTVLHGHLETNAEKIIMGHEHPAIKVRKEGAVYSFPCYLHVRERNAVVLPAFSPLAPGSNIIDSNSFLSPILDVKIDEVEVYAVDEEVIFLGKVRDVRKAIYSESGS